MKSLVNNSVDPHFNLAFDQWCLEHWEGEPRTGPGEALQVTIQEGSKEERVGGGGDSVLPGWEWGRGLPLTGTLCAPCSTVRTKVYAVLELWVQVCGASAGVLQGGASGEALLSHLAGLSIPSSMFL